MEKIDQVIDHILGSGGKKHVKEVHVYGPHSSVLEIGRYISFIGIRVVPHHPLDEGGKENPSLAPLLTRI